ISFPGVAEEKMVSALRDLAVSSGSACNSAAIAPSYVLDALGVSPERSKTTFRFGFGRFTTEAEVEYAAHLLMDTLHRLHQK
ncbi:MAG: IscS subfamily cysteine desulfurase, partial [Rickettsiales bacterium]